MVIGTSDGQTYESHWDLKMAQNERPVTTNYEGTISDVGQQYGVRPELLTKQLKQESSFDPSSGKYDTRPSSAGARGPAQFMPETAKRYGVDVTNVESSIKGQARYMSDLQKQFGGNEGLALAAYNWGEGNVQKYLAGKATPPKETRDYVQKITGKAIEEWSGQPHIDREHDVPFGASGLRNAKGEYYGTAIDRHIPHQTQIEGISFDPAMFVEVHERAEHDPMVMNMKTGMEDEKAYAKAHDEHATPAEKEAVMTFAKAKGKDPQKFWDQYQAKWQGWLKEIKDHEPERAHPDMVLEPYPKELRAKMEKAREQSSLSKQGFTDVEHKSDMQVMRDIGKETEGAKDIVKMLEDPSHRKSTNIEDVRGQSIQDRHLKFLDEYSEYLTKDEKEEVAYVRQLIHKQGDQDVIDHNLAVLFNRIVDKTAYWKALDNPPLPRKDPRK